MPNPMSSQKGPAIKGRRFAIHDDDPSQWYGNVFVSSEHSAHSDSDADGSDRVRGTLKRFGRRLFIEGWMAPVFLGGLVLFGLVAGIVGAL